MGTSQTLDGKKMSLDCKKGKAVKSVIFGKFQERS